MRVILALVFLCLSHLACDEPSVIIGVDDQVPPNFSFNGNGSIPFFVVFELSSEFQSTEDMRSAKVIWEIRPMDYSHARVPMPNHVRFNPGRLQPDHSRRRYSKTARGGKDLSSWRAANRNAERILTVHSAKGKSSSPWDVARSQGVFATLDGIGRHSAKDEIISSPGQPAT